MSAQMKLAMAAAALVTFGPPALAISSADAAVLPAADCVNGVVVNSYPPVTCTPAGGGGETSGAGTPAPNTGGGGGGGDLPFTGADLIAMTLGGGLLLLVGGTVVVLARRRSADTSAASATVA